MFNKDKLQGFVSGVIITTMIMAISITGFAATTTMNINAVYDNIKIYINEKLIEPKDANGNEVEPFIYNGTTYLPVRAVAEAFDQPVHWDGATKSVYIGSRQVQTTTKQPIVLSSGNYIAGTDFPAGTYDIVALSSGGNVMSSNSFNGGINAIIGTSDMNDDLGIEFYEGSYKNISLPQGTELSLMGAMGNFQIQLIPSR